MNNSQFLSVVGAIAAILVGGVSIFFGWVTPPEGMAIILAGLSILGVHTGGSYAGAQRKQRLSARALLPARERPIGKVYSPIVYSLCNSFSF